MSKRFEKYKAQGTFIANAWTVAYGKISCYENITHGDDAAMVIFSEKGEDISDEFDAWDMDTVTHLAEDM